MRCLFACLFRFNRCVHDTMPSDVNSGINQTSVVMALLSSSRRVYCRMIRWLVVQSLVDPARVLSAVPSPWVPRPCGSIIGLGIGLGVGLS